MIDLYNTLIKKNQLFPRSHAEKQDRGLSKSSDRAGSHVERIDIKSGAVGGKPSVKRTNK